MLTSLAYMVLALLPGSYTTAYFFVPPVFWTVTGGYHVFSVSAFR